MVKKQKNKKTKQKQNKKPFYQCRSCKRCRFDTWVRKIPWGGHVNPLQHSLGQRSLVGYFLQDQKSQTRLKQLNTHFSLIFNIDLALLSTVFTSLLSIINKLINEANKQPITVNWGP